MKSLEELVNICPPKLVKLLLRGNSRVTAEQSLIRKLYRLIQQGEKTEEQIVKALYGREATPTLDKYRALKTRLRRVLIEVLLLDQPTDPKYHTYDQAYQNGYKMLAIGRLLAGRNAYKAARELLVKTLQKVQDFEIVPLNLGLTDLLAGLHLGTGYNENQFNRYNELSIYYNQAYSDLNLLTQRYRQIRNQVYAQRESPLETGKKAQAYAQESEGIRDKYPDISLIQATYAILDITGCTMQGLYREAIQAARRGGEALQACRGASESTLSMMAVVRVECTIKLGDFALGKEQIAAARATTPNDVVNLIKLSEYAVLLGLRTRNYEFAYKELAAVNRRVLRKTLYANHIEYWYILEAYVNLLILAGELEVQPDWPPLPKFRISKFINEVPTYSKVKKGMNIQILILQALFLIVKGNYDKVADRTDALSSYCNRYLRDDGNLRNNCFFKLLLIAIQANFSLVATERKGQKTLARMKRSFDFAAMNDTEIIPYEDLWDILTKHLVGPKYSAYSS